MSDNLSLISLLAQTNSAAPAAAASTSVPAADPGTSPTAPEKPGIFNPSFVIAIIIFMLAFIFLIDRPRKKREAEAKNKVDSIKKGTRIVTAGGIHGKVSRVDKNKNTVFVTVANGVEIEFNRASLNIQVDEIEKSDKPVAEEKKDKK